MIRSLRIYLANGISNFLPQTRFFGVRRWLYRRSGVDVGAGTRINGGVVIQFPNVSIGASTWVGRRTEFASTARARISIGERCDISQDVLLICGSHEIGPSSRRAGAGTATSIVVGDGVWIGARVTLLGGSRVGNGSVVAAGSLVRGTFPDNVLIAGSPARIVRDLAVDGAEASGSRD